MGDNTYGQLGQGSDISNTNLPVKIINGGVSVIAAGSAHSLFVETNNSLWAMGYNAFGQLGDTTTANHYVPEQIVSSGVTGVAAGGYHSLFTTVISGRFSSTFMFWAMGQNIYGQLGDGTETSRSSPELIQSTGILFDVVYSFTGGGEQSLYVLENGLWGTGDNTSGQLGLGTTNNEDSYTESLSDNVATVASGSVHTVFLDTSSNLWAMGDDAYGELGDNSTGYRDTPVQVAAHVTSMAPGNYDSFFLETNGSLWAMGANAYGQLGNGTTTDQHSPVQIVASNVVAVSAGGYTSYFIKSDGSLWAMGYNGNGTLGDGTLTDRHLPVQIVPLIIPQPVLTGVTSTTTNLVLNGTNGESGRTYYTLRSTNLMQPFKQWAPVATNILSSDGSFSITATNAVLTNAAQQYYVLQVE